MPARATPTVPVNANPVAPASRPALVRRDVWTAILTTIVLTVWEVILASGIKETEFTGAALKAVRNILIIALPHCM